MSRLRAGSVPKLARRLLVHGADSLVTSRCKKLKDGSQSGFSEASYAKASFLSSHRRLLIGAAVCPRSKPGGRRKRFEHGYQYAHVGRLVLPDLRPQPGGADYRLLLY